MNHGLTDEKVLEHIIKCPKCGKYTTTFKSLCPHCKHLMNRPEEDERLQKLFKIKKITSALLILLIIASVMLLHIFFPFFIRDTETREYVEYSQELETGTPVTAHILTAMQAAGIETETPLSNINFPDINGSDNNNPSNKYNIYYYLAFIDNLQNTDNSNEAVLFIEVKREHLEIFNELIESNNTFEVSGTLVELDNNVVAKAFSIENGKINSTLKDNTEILNYIKSHKVLSFDPNPGDGIEVILPAHITWGGYAFMASIVLMIAAVIANSKTKRKITNFLIKNAPNDIIKSRRTAPSADGIESCNNSCLLMGLTLIGKYVLSAVGAITTLVGIFSFGDNRYTVLVGLGFLVLSVLLIAFAKDRNSKIDLQDRLYKLSTSGKLEEISTSTMAALTLYKKYPEKWTFKFIKSVNPMAAELIIGGVTELL